MHDSLMDATVAMLAKQAYLLVGRHEGNGGNEGSHKVRLVAHTIHPSTNQRRVISDINKLSSCHTDVLVAHLCIQNAVTEPLAQRFRAPGRSPQEIDTALSNKEQI